MRLRNNIFAEAFDYLKREKGIKTQKRLAELMGVSEDTITRILKDRTEVTEDIITKLQTASGCIFNLQWLRGEDDEPMLAADIGNKNMHQSASIIDPGSAINAALAAKDETIETLKARIVELKSTIADKEDMIKARDARIVDLEQKLAKIQISDIDNYPFSIGAAEERQKRKNI